MTQIKNRFTDEVIAEGDTVREALQKAIESGVNLRDVNLRDVNLRGANLRGANLSGANLSGANLSGAYLSGANLSGAYLSSANLSGANLSGASIVPTSLDTRGYVFYVTWTRGEDNPAPVIRAGCKRWRSFDDARSHYGDGYDSDGDTVECLAIVNFMEARFKALTQQEAA